MPKEYIHPELNQKITSIAGHYVLVKEGRLPFRGREVVYTIGYGVFDTTCCGVGGCLYALVPGFVLNWHVRYDEQGRPVSLVEPIRDEATQSEIRRLLKEKEKGVVNQIRFL